MDNEPHRPKYTNKTIL